MERLTPEHEAEIRKYQRLPNQGAHHSLEQAAQAVHDLLAALDAMRQERDEAVWHRDDFARIAAIEATRASELYDAKLQAEQRVATLRKASSNLVALVELWIDGYFGLHGITWSTEPPPLEAMRKALAATEPVS